MWRGRLALNVRTALSACERAPHHAERDGYFVRKVMATLCGACWPVGDDLLGKLDRGDGETGEVLLGSAGGRREGRCGRGRPARRCRSRFDGRQRQGILLLRRYELDSFLLDYAQLGRRMPDGWVIAGPEYRLMSAGHRFRPFCANAAGSVAKKVHERVDVGSASRGEGDQETTNGREVKPESKMRSAAQT